MKLIVATLIGASAAKLRGQANDAAGAPKRDERDLQGALQLFGDTGGSGGDLFGCNEACDDSSLCTSVLMSFDPTSLFEDMCNKGCFATTKLNMCKEFCKDGDEAAAEAATTAVTRLGFFDSAVDLMCSDCKFYECCISNEASASTTAMTKFDACKGFLADDAQDQATGDSILDQLADAFGVELSESSSGGGSSIVDQLVESVTDTLDAFTEAFGDDTDSFGGFDFLDWTDGSWGGSDADPSYTDPFGDIELPEWVDGSWGDEWDAGSWGDAAADWSILEEFGETLECPQTCTDENLCNSFLAGTANQATLEFACNQGCLPNRESCDDVCGNQNLSQASASVSDFACDTCRFLMCCSKNVDGTVLAETKKFDTCKAQLPEIDDLVTGIQVVDFNLDVQGLIDSMDWNGFADAIGLSDLIESFHTMIDEAVSSFVDAIPVQCDSDSCPITGLCDLSLDLASVDADDACKDNALFACGAGLEELCDNECAQAPASLTSPTAATSVTRHFGLDFGYNPLCSLCDIARCCRDEPDATFESCASASLPQDFAQEVEGENQNEDPTDVAPESSVSEVEAPTAGTPDEEESSPETSPEAEAPAAGTPDKEEASPETSPEAESSSSDTSEEVESDETPAGNDETLESTETSEGSVVAGSADPLSGPAASTEPLEVSRVVSNSAAATSMHATLASIAALYFVLL